MKQFLVFVLSSFAALTLHAQAYLNTVTLSVMGNKNLQLKVDDRDYSTSNGTMAGDKTTFVFDNFDAGTHSIQVSRTDLNTNRQVRITATFNLRPGYDMLVKVNQDGSLELIETRVFGSDDKLVPISNTNFNTLLKNVRLQRSAAARSNLITNAFTNTNYSFTTNRVALLLNQVNSESFRLQLAKLSYRVVSDRGNFYQLQNLLTSQASKNELADYVYNYDTGDLPDDPTDENPNAPMSDADFDALHRTIQQQWPVSNQMTSLTNAFNNAAYRFTTSQAGRLIRLVTAESNRLQLAKLSYRSITDKNNFYQIYDLLPSQASRNELDAYVTNYSASNPNTPMSDAAFNSLHQSIQQQWPVSTQMNSLSDAFNNTNNYFTATQASRLIQLVSAESNRLQLAKLSYRSIIDKNNFNLIYNLLPSQASRNELDAYVANYNSSGPNTPMSSTAFNSLYQTIQQQWPVSTQMNSLSDAFNNSNNYFTATQASQLIQLVSAESNRLQLAKLSYRSITDKSNFNLIFNLLPSQASRNELQAYINNYGSGTTTKVPMSDQNFNTLYQNIERQYLPFEQYNSLIDVFNNPAYYFTTAQVKKLIPMVSLESNRLQLAKLSYRTVTDRNNFSQVYDLLSSQSSKDELDAYVRAYRDQ